MPVVPQQHASEIAADEIPIDLTRLNMLNSVYQGNKKRIRTLNDVEKELASGQHETSSPKTKKQCTGPRPPSASSLIIAVPFPNAEENIYLVAPTPTSLTNYTQIPNIAIPIPIYPSN